MFKLKQKKNPLNLVKNTLASSSKTMASGMKYAADMGHQISKNANISMLKDTIQKRPTSGVLVAAGLGLAIFGILRLIRK